MVGSTLWVSLAKFNPGPHARRSKAFGGEMQARLERGQIMPDIGGRLARRHQRAAVEIERMDHHQIIAQAEILDDEPLRIGQDPVA